MNHLNDNDDIDTSFLKVDANQNMEINDYVMEEVFGKFDDNQPPPPDPEKWTTGKTSKKKKKAFPRPSSMPPPDVSVSSLQAVAAGAAAAGVVGGTLASNGATKCNTRLVGTFLTIGVGALYLGLLYILYKRIVTLEESLEKATNEMKQLTALLDADHELNDVPVPDRDDVDSQLQEQQDDDTLDDHTLDDDDTLNDDESAVPKIEELPPTPPPSSSHKPPPRTRKQRPKTPVLNLDDFNLS
jgi:hypothetical protein